MKIPIKTEIEIEDNEFDKHIVYQLKRMFELPTQGHLSIHKEFSDSIPWLVQRYAQKSAVDGKTRPIAIRIRESTYKDEHIVFVLSKIESILDRREGA